jgi:hypothetical protein
MNATLAAEYDDKVSEFASAEHADAYTKWLRSEIQQRRNDGSVGIPHDQVMRRMDAVLSKYPVQRAA